MDEQTIYSIPPRNPGEGTLAVRFEWISEKNDAASAEAGVDVFDAVLIALVRGLGDRSEAATEIKRRLPDGREIVRAQPMQRYGHLVKLFEAGDEGPVDGTPLQQLPAMDAATMRNLKSFGVRSVEMLADMPDSNAQLVAGLMAWKHKARAYVEGATGSAAVSKLATENATLQRQLESLQRQFADLAARVSQAPEEAPPKRGPGRPPREPVAA